MARKKRPYVPKTKGCFECSRRRIHCDRTNPSCNKCVSRDMTCSGYGFQFRFRHGLPQKAETTKPSDSPTRDNHRGLNCRSSPEDVETGDMSGNNHESIGNLICPATFYNISPIPALGSGDCWKLSLLDYFSKRIAPEMVVIDDSHNGWRQLVLPIAHMDDIVMDAVLTASIFHISGRGAHPFGDPTNFYARAIKKLQTRQDLTRYDVQTQRCVIMAILVLLVAVMVNGYSDFPIVFGMLQSALGAVGGEESLVDAEVARFLLRQIHKMRVWGAPFISQDAGTQALRFEAQRSFDCLQYSYQLHPDHSNLLKRIANLRQQAYDIYLHRVSTEYVPTTFTSLIENFKSSLELFPEGSLGEHALIWTCFIAASESHLPDHQQSFERFLVRQYHRNGFANILKALELLKRIWKRNPHENWTALLPEPQVFIM